MNAVSCLRRCARLSKERAVHNLDSIQSSTAVNLMWPAQHWINGDNSSHWKRANFDRLLVLVMMQLCTNELCSSPCRCSTVIRAFQRYARTDCLSQYVYIAFINYHQDQAIGRKLICRMTKGIFYMQNDIFEGQKVACWVWRAGVLIFFLNFGASISLERVKLCTSHFAHKLCSSLASYQISIRKLGVA